MTKISPLVTQSPRENPSRESRDAPRGSGRIVRSFLWSLLLLSAGCHTLSKPIIGLPQKATFRTEQLLVMSDVKLPKSHPLLSDLEKLRGEVSRVLDLPLQQQQVVVYLFADEDRYRKYLKKVYPQLPERPAYFVGTPKELAVYTYWGERIHEDLRHEYTHGVLHATLKDVPLWLDEGLAEYFEVVGETGALNREYSNRIATSLTKGWRPHLERLERLNSVEQMHKADYQESWAWVHFLLHNSDESRAVLLEYLQDLRTNPQPGILSRRLRAAIPTLDQQIASYLGAINTQAIGTAQRSNR